MKRNRRAGVEDRWTKAIRDEHGNKRTEQSPMVREAVGGRGMSMQTVENTLKDSGARLTRRRG
jgi:hypothetical protein